MKKKGIYVLIALLAVILIVNGCTGAPATDGNADKNTQRNLNTQTDINARADGNANAGTIRKLPTLIRDTNNRLDGNNLDSNNNRDTNAGTLDANVPITAKPKTCEDEGTDREKDLCYKKAALKSKVLTDCDKIQTESIQDGCYNSIALENRDIEGCLKMSEGSTATRDPCISVLAIEKNESEHCASLSTQEGKDNCYSKISAATHNTALCPSIIDETLKDQCDPSVKQRLQEFERCKALTAGTERTDCITDVAVDNGTIEWCNELGTDKAAVNTCQEAFVPTFGADTLSTTCVQLAYANLRNQCFYKIATLKPDKDQCRNITDGNTVDTCYYVISETQNDPDLCKRIRFTNVDIYKGCILRVAPLAGDTALCELADKASDYLDCYQLVGIEHGWEKCNAMEKDYHTSNGYSYQGICVKKVAVETNKLNICDNIVSTPVRDACKRGDADFK